MSSNEAFWRIHDGLPRQAPGSEQTTLHLLDLAGRPRGNGLDIGCGPGRASILLLESGIEELVSIDTHQPFLDELTIAAQAHKVSDRLTIRNLSMQDLDYPSASFDFIWSEGAAYLMGLEEAMRSWRHQLQPEGTLVITECCWLTNKRSSEVRDFWKEHYPNMPTAEEVFDKASRTGYTLVAAYTLPKSDWDEYYVPMKARVALLEGKADEDLRKALEETEREITMHEKYGNEYGYVGFVLKKKD